MSDKTFHVSLPVTDIPTAVERYRRILGVEPAKLFPDYAKFELADPPLILSVNLGGQPGTVAHLGIRHRETREVQRELGRIRGAGLEVLEEHQTTCCYAEADKFWVKDADGMAWEIYAVTGDADVHSLAPPAPAEPSLQVACCEREATRCGGE